MGKLNQTQVAGLIFPIAVDGTCALHFCLVDTGHSICVPVSNWLIAAQTALASIAANGDTVSKATATTLLITIPRVNAPQ